MCVTFESVLITKMQISSLQADRFSCKLENVNKHKIFASFGKNNFFCNNFKDTFFVFFKADYEYATETSLRGTVEPQKGRNYSRGFG